MNTKYQIHGLLLAIALCCSSLLHAQVQFGVKAGMSSADISPKDILIFGLNDARQLKLLVDDSNYGVHLGVFLQIPIGKFFLRPEVLFNSNEVDYQIEDFRLAGNNVFFRSERYQNLDLPILLGTKLAFLRIQGGPVAHVFLDNTSGLFDIDGYSQDFKDTSWGWQAGVGIDIWKFALDFRYEGNFTKYGDHINLFGQDVNFADNANRLLFSVGLNF